MIDLLGDERVALIQQRDHKTNSSAG
jgi:hypothetical protein